VSLGNGALLEIASADNFSFRGRGLHSSNFQLNLSRV